jgi:hypothetical protein
MIGYIVYSPLVSGFVLASGYAFCLGLADSFPYNDKY